MENLLPHSKEMILINSLEFFSPKLIKVKAKIKSNSPFVKDEKFATFQTIEIMAQTLGVYDTKMCELANIKPSLGFLLGSRKFEIFKDFLEVGDEILAVCKPSFQSDDGFGVYECECFLGENLVSKGNLNIFKPSKKALMEIINE